MKYVIRALLVLVAIIATSILYIFYSIYSSYYQGVRSAESYKHAKSIAILLSEHYSTHSKYPRNIGDLNLKKPELNHIGKIIFDNQTGIIKMQIAGESLNEGVLMFFPKIKNNNELSYICHPLNIPIDYLPEECVAKKTDSNSSSQPTVYDVE